MVVGVCGYGYTGSGAVIDLLTEYEECSVNDDFEFCFTYIPYGLQDLKYSLIDHPSRYNSSEAAIKNFQRWVKAQNSIHNYIMMGTNRKFISLSKQFIEKLVSVSWKGYSSFDYVHYTWFQKKVLFRINRRILKFCGKHFHFELPIFPNSEMCVGITDEDAFMKASREYIGDIIESMRIDTRKIMVLNQPFEANAPEQSFPYFNDPRAIVVDKDPRDLYLLAKIVIGTDARFIPTDSVDDFIRFYKTTHACISSNDRILRLNFESLIYDYEATKMMIEKFVGVSNHALPRTRFNPQESINNTQLFLKYREYEDDIKRIKDELKEWLFPFELYDEAPHFESGSF